MSSENTLKGSPAESGGPEQMNAANKSLADALRFSFRLLSVIMVIALGLLLLTGMARIKPQQAGLKLLFGRIQGTGDGRVFGEGLRLSWPEPVGRVERVSIESKKLKIDDFWMYEKPDEMNKKLEDRQPSMEGLRPGYDGVLLTGDRGLVHVKFTCSYSFKPKEKKAASPSPSAVINFLSNIADPKEVIRSAVCNAAIHASAARTVEAICSASQEEHDKYVREIRVLAQKQLDALDSGIKIDRILRDKATVPIAALAAFNAVTSARSERSMAINAARRQANEILGNAAGANWRKLIGDLEEPGLIDSYSIALKTNDRATASRLLAEMDATGLLALYPKARKAGPAEAAAKLLEEIDRVGLRQLARRAKRDGHKKTEQALEAEIERIGLLRLYARARETENLKLPKELLEQKKKLAAELLEEINGLLMSHKTGGAVTRVIQVARGYSADVRELARRRAETFQQVLPKFEADPELMLTRRWADVKQKVLTAPTNRKWYFAPGPEINLMIGEPPEIGKRIERLRLEKDKETKEKDRAARRRR